MLLSSLSSFYLAPVTWTKNMSPLFQLFVYFLLVANGIYRVELSMFDFDGICTTNWHCTSPKVCCKDHLIGIFHCRKQLNHSWSALGSTRSCIGYYCTSKSDCRERELCCTSNTCTPCSKECVTHSDCGKWRSCCKGARWERNQCRHTCVNMLCTDHSDCGINECCRSQHCVHCSELGCTADAQCLPSQQCCDQHFYPNSKCRNQCSGESCNSDKDCTLSAYCDSHICVERKECTSQANCSDGWFCCMTGWYQKIGYCSQNCIGNSCMKDSDCALPDECCSSNYKCKKCVTSCQSSSDCFNNGVCCEGPAFGESKCAAKCNEESCIKSSDCLTPGKWCLNGICSDATKQCRHDSECIASGGKQYYCCIDKHTGLKICSLDCDGRECISDHNCTGENECCNSDGSCVTSGCPWKIPKWLFLLFIAVIMLVLIIIICWCYLKKKNLLNRHRSGQNAMVPGPENRSDEMQGLSSTHLDSTVCNDRIEQRASLPSYRLSNALVSSGNNVAGAANIPPPPYSFDSQIASPELNNEPPPRYRVIQM